MDAKKRKRGWIIGVAVFATIVTACVLLWYGYWNKQEEFAKDATLRVERALKQIDTDETAKELRTKLVEEIGEFDEVVEVYYYVSPAPGCAYIHGTLSKDGDQYHFEFFLMGEKIRFWGASKKIQKEEGTTVNSLEDRD